MTTKEVTTHALKVQDDSIAATSRTKKAVAETLEVRRSDVVLMGRPS